MATIMTKQGQLDNVITYEHICDTVADMANINPSYITLGSVCIVIKGESDGLEVYMANSRKEWEIVSFGAGGSGGEVEGAAIHICAQDEYDSATGIPTIQAPLSNTFYLTPGSGETNDLYNEWIWLEEEEKWEKFGSASSGQSDWEQANTTTSDFIKNKPSIKSGTASYSILESKATKASGIASHAEGQGTHATGDNAHAEGYNSVASGQRSHAEGNETQAIGEDSHAEGGGSDAKGNASHAEGSQTVAEGYASHTEGEGTKAQEEASHAEGFGTTASGFSSHAEGNNTTASGQGSHAEGGGTQSKGDYAHAEGGGARANGANSHAEGTGTTASGNSSHAEGAGTLASGANSHTEGLQTIANHLAQHVFGMNNVPDNSTANADMKGNYVEIVGNGLTNNSLSNARTLDWEGNEEVAGDIRANACGGANPISLVEVSNNVENKLNKNQGLVNAGKMLGINSEGEVQPIQVLGGNVSVTETLESGEDYSMVIEEGEPTAVTSVAGKYGTVTLDAGDIEYDEQEVYNSGTVGKKIGDLKSQMSADVAELKSALEGKINLESGTFTDATGTTKVSMVSRLRTVNPLNASTIGLIEIADGYEAYGFLLDSSLQKIGTLAWSTTIRQSSVASAAYVNIAIRKVGATSQDISADVSAVENGTTLYSTQQIDTASAKAKIDGLFNVSFSENGYISNTGTNAGTSTSFRRTDYIPLSGVLFGIEYAMCLDSNGNIVSFYDENKLYLNGVAGAGNNTVKSGMLAYPDGAKYVRFSYCVASSGITNPEPVIRLKDIPQYSGIGSNAVKTDSIADKAVTMEKCSFIIHDPETNYINKSDYSDGYINASGAFVPNAGWRATGFCALLPNTKYYSGGLHGGYCAFYKADRTTVIAAYGAYEFTVAEFTTPAETAYARFSLNAASQSIDAAWINIKNEKPEDYGYILDGIGTSGSTDNPCDYDGREIAVFNKILCVGDSMTEGTFNHLDSGTTQWISYAKYSYPTYLHKMTGVDVTNMGHGGQTSVQWYNTEQNTDLSGYDCAIIQLGINDFGVYGELGADTKTAFQNIIAKLKTENKNIKIFVANIIPATSYSSDGYKTFSTALLEWLETTYASDPSVIPVDIQRYGHTGNAEAFNAGHLTALGYRMLARDYIGFISDYIKNNGSVFREVQFIGTDYWYVNPNS